MLAPLELLSDTSTFYKSDNLDAMLWDSNNKYQKLLCEVSVQGIIATPPNIYSLVYLVNMQ